MKHLDMQLVANLLVHKAGHEVMGDCLMIEEACLNTELNAEKVQAELTAVLAPKP